MFDSTSSSETPIGGLSGSSSSTLSSTPPVAESVMTRGTGSGAAPASVTLDTSRATGVLRELARCEVRGADEAALLRAATDLVGVISDAQTVLGRVLAELDAHATTDSRFGMRTASWVASQTGTPRGPITGRLRVGKALRSDFDVIDAALRDGRLSFEHAKALVDTANPRNVAALAAAQDEIIALAQGATFDTWKNDIAALGELADTDGSEPDPYADLSLKMPVTMDRTVHLDGTLDHASGLVFREAINTKTDELFRRFTRDAKTSSGDITIPNRATLRALALMELIREATGAKAGTGAAPRAEITLVAHNHEVCDTNGVPLPRAAAAVWGCDPDIWGVVVDNMGIPADVGHTSRLATVAQRHAIRRRDGGCTFPGCDAPINWCDMHHVTDWHHGGPTDLANLVALCRHHHGVTHRTGWTMHLDDNQVPHWRTPAGHHLTGQRHHRRQATDQGPQQASQPPGQPPPGRAARPATRPAARPVAGPPPGPPCHVTRPPARC